MRLIPISSFFVGLSVTAGLLQAQDITALRQRAVELQQAGENAAAADAYRAVIKLQPGDVAAHVNLGVMLVNMSKFDEALAEYEAADRLLPGDPRIALNSALAYEKSGRLQEAAARFEKLHAAAPQEQQVTMLLADCYLQLGDDQRVIDLLEPFASVNSGDLGLAYMLGMALLHTQRIQEGQVLLDRILRHGDTPEARFLLGTRIFESGDYPAAVKQLASAVELNPRMPQLQSFYGRALLETGDPDGAAEAFRKELAGNPRDFASNLSLAQILIARKHFNDARPLLDRVLYLRPDSNEAKLSLAECLADCKSYREALPLANAAVAAMPNSVDVHNTLAAIYAGLNRGADAARERDKARLLASAADPGPKLYQNAPSFELTAVATHERISLQRFRGKSPIVLVFGSYSCPNFRDAAPALISMYRRYAARVPFLLVYIREAHAGEDWQSTRNTRDNVALPPAATFGEKHDHATMCSRKLHLPFPAAVDGMDGAVEQAYNAWPSRAFVIDDNGRVIYSTRLTELDFRPAEMEHVLRQVLR